MRYNSSEGASFLSTKDKEIPWSRKGPPAQGQQQNNRSEHCKRAETDISSVAALLYLKYDI